MKAIGYTQTGPITTPGILVEFDAQKPELGPHDLLVKINGIAMNPVDTKVRVRLEPQDGPHILGYDAAGVVVETGSEVSLFSIGDEVFYAGDITRPGCNAEFQAVDERIVGKKPNSLGFNEAAAIPLTAITAWEMLFDSFGFAEGDGEGETLLIIGGAGGVGSILIQLAKKLTKLNVIATASRPETLEWVKKMGADQVIDHHQSIADQLSEAPKYVAGITHTDQHFPAIVETIQPRGHLVLIDDPVDFVINPAKQKAISITWEFMFSRSMFQTDDLIKQHQLLTRVSEMVDRGELVSMVTKDLGNISVETITQAHINQESGTMIGKQVLSGY